MLPGFIARPAVKVPDAHRVTFLSRIREADRNTINTEKKDKKKKTQTERALTAAARRCPREGCGFHLQTAMSYVSSFRFGLYPSEKKMLITKRCSS
jgi:hypothetical protein